ncbi:MAG: glycosyl transferase family protein, partial [Alteraurantiacibacter sp.]
AAGTDRRVRLVVHDCDGPSTKADCLNRLYRAMEVDERRMNAPYRMILLHDAEDMVDPAALALLDKAMDRAEFVQLPVVPLPQHGKRWLGSHYCEEFAEAHGKTLVVRDWLGTCLPAAGVGCAVDRAILRRLADAAGGVPFSLDSLTEDYELGLRVSQFGGRSRFLRVRGEDGSLIATRAYFPARLDEAVRQKARWVHGIALQGWDRLGWGDGSLAECWMRARDRRGPMAALVLACGYGFFALSGVLMLLDQVGLARPWQGDSLLSALVTFNLLAFVWRAAWRAGFTAREHGWRQGALSVARIPLANVIAIMAGRRAFTAYLRTLAGGLPRWEKTRHDRHPAPAPLALASLSEPFGLATERQVA